jgi:hypothetical protein
MPYNTGLPKSKRNHADMLQHLMALFPNACNNEHVGH